MDVQQTRISIHSRSGLVEKLSDVFLAIGVAVQLARAVQGCPFGLFFKEAHGLDVLIVRVSVKSLHIHKNPSSAYICLISRKAVIDARREDKQVVLDFSPFGQLVALTFSLLHHDTTESTGPQTFSSRTRIHSSPWLRTSK